jgi:hypothetical protein
LATGALAGLIFTGCAATSGSKAAQTQAAPFSVQADANPARERSVQAVALDPTGTDGQSSWIIEPDVPRIPKIAGLEAKMPPHIERRMSYAFDLAQRGATYSANAEFRAVLGLCALELDAQNGGTTRREALRQGFVALDEADEFRGAHIEGRDSADVRRAAAVHATPVLQQDVKTPVDAIQAVQSYYAYAERRLAAACEGMPAASLAFYGLGRTLAMPGAETTNAAGKAALLQRVALAVAPQNVLAGNELGVLFAQHGHLDEAEKLFQQCVATNATPETWRNLSVIYARKGNENASRAAQQAGDALAANAPRPAAAPAAAAGDEGSPSSASPASHSTEKRGILARLNLAPELPRLLRR